MTFFKRASTHYGKTPEPETPYQKAAQVWDERVGTARVQAKTEAIVDVFHRPSEACRDRGTDQAGVCLDLVAEIDRQHRGREVWSITEQEGCSDAAFVLAPSCDLDGRGEDGASQAAD